MTIAEAIAKTDKLKPNRFNMAQKLAWLSDIEGQIYTEIVATHEDPEGHVLQEFTEDTDTDTVLIAPYPYSEVYTLYLQSQIDLGNMEIAKYNNSKTLFNNAFMTLRDYWTRKHMPLCDITHFQF